MSAVSTDEPSRASLATNELIASLGDEDEENRTTRASLTSDLHKQGARDDRRGSGDRQSRSRRASFVEILAELKRKGEELDSKAIPARDLFRTLDADRDGRVAVDVFYESWRKTPSKKDFEQWTAGTSAAGASAKDAAYYDGSGAEHDVWEREQAVRELEDDTASGTEGEASAVVAGSDEAGTRDSSLAILSDMDLSALRDAFVKYDKDKDGLLSESEFITLFAFHTGSALSIQQAKQLFARLDADKNGMVSFDELKSMFRLMRSQPHVLREALDEENGSLGRMAEAGGAPPLKPRHHIAGGITAGAGPGSEAESETGGDLTPGELRLGPVTHHRRLKSGNLEASAEKHKMLVAAEVLQHKAKANKTRVELLHQQLQMLEAENRRLIASQRVMLRERDQLLETTRKLRVDLASQFEAASHMQTRVQLEEKERQEVRAALDKVRGENRSLRAALSRQALSPTGASSPRNPFAMSPRRRKRSQSPHSILTPPVQASLRVAAETAARLREEKAALEAKMQELAQKYEATITRQMDEINDLSTKLRRRRSLRQRSVLQVDISCDLGRRGARGGGRSGALSIDEKNVALGGSINSNTRTSYQNSPPGQYEIGEGAREGDDEGSRSSFFEANTDDHSGKVTRALRCQCAYHCCRLSKRRPPAQAFLLKKKKASIARAAGKESDQEDTACCLFWFRSPSKKSQGAE